MNRHLFVIIGTIVMGIVPTLAHASIYEQIIEEVDDQYPREPYIDEEIADFVIRYFENERDITLTESDLDDAINGGRAICESDAQDYVSCDDLLTDIFELIRTEQDVQKLGDDLMTIAQGSEYTVSHEPQGELSLAPISQMFSAIWSGTGGQALGWPGTLQGDGNNPYDQALQRLENALDVEDEEIEQTVMRFAHGYFRAGREEQTSTNDGLSQYGDAAKDVLADIAALLEVDPDRVGEPDLNEYLVPAFQNIENVRLWVREDDLGLSFVYNVHMPRFNIQTPDEYPSYYDNEGSDPEEDLGLVLSYPFRYDGDPIEEPENLQSPTCSRLGARQGYLCRPLERISENCVEKAENAPDDGINIITCDEDESTNPVGPAVCIGEEFTDLFTLNNPNISQNDLRENGVCIPMTETTYQASLVGNACYVSLCLAESLSGHTLVPNRNTVAVMEQTSPYLACMRDDPQIGLFAEMPPINPSVIPEYLGHRLVYAYDRAFCNQVGAVDLGVSGICSYRIAERIESPFSTYLDTISDANVQKYLADESQQQLLEIGYPMGQYLAFEQTLPAYRNIAHSMAQFIGEVAELFTSLENAPITTNACPTGGPLPANQCGSPEPPPPSSSPSTGE